MNLRRLLAGIAAVALGLSPLAREAGAVPAPPSANAQSVSASDPRFRYEGRFDFGDPGSPVVIWEASRIRIDFEGVRVAVRFRGTTGQVFLNASVDGVASILDLREGTPETTLALPVSGPGLHHLMLFKRSEATAGITHFAGIEIAPGARAFSPAAPDYRMKMEFIGDSITAGACDEDGNQDQWNDRRTHNAAFSWAAVTAGVFSADYRNISVSGIGVATGYAEVLSGQVWDRIYPNASSPKVNLQEWTPDVVLVLLGDNDDSFPRSHKLPFPQNFREKYVSLVHAIRTAYPMSRIVLLNGAMWAGTQSPALRTEWGAAVSELESRDSAISHYEFVHWTMNHPRVADHRALAEELVAWLKTQPFMSVASARPR